MHEQTCVCVCDKVGLGEGIRAWGGFGEMQLTTLCTYENSGLVLFEDVKLVDLLLALSKCK